MATGIAFPEANTVLRAPTPEDAAAGTVYDLHVHRYVDLDGNPNVISNWQFKPDELASVIANDGKFWFHCWGHTHPPVGIEGASPFVRGTRREGSDGEAEMLPANAYAIARSIAVVDQFMEDDESHILMPDVGESIMLVMHELKRLRTITAEAVAWVSPEQLQAVADRPQDNGGEYIPVRKSPAGNFTMALHALPPAKPGEGPGEAAAFCNMPNCRNRAPADQPFCAQHRHGQHNEGDGRA